MPALASLEKEDVDVYDGTTPPFSQVQKKAKRSPKRKANDLERAVIHKQRGEEKLKAEAREDPKAAGLMMLLKKS